MGGSADSIVRLPAPPSAAAHRDRSGCPFRRGSVARRCCALCLPPACLSGRLSARSRSLCSGFCGWVDQSCPGRPRRIRCSRPGRALYPPSCGPNPRRAARLSRGIPSGAAGQRGRALRRRRGAGSSAAICGGLREYQYLGRCHRADGCCRLCLHGRRHAVVLKCHAGEQRPSAGDRDGAAAQRGRDIAFNR